MGVKTNAKTTAKKAKAAKRDENKPKRSCNAFCFFVRDQAKSIKSGNGKDKMVELHEQWKRLDARQKAPFEAQAATDCDRYKREKEEYESNRLKRPCNSYVLYIQDFMRRNAASFANVCLAVQAGAAAWNRMSDTDKAPFKRMSEAASKEYASKAAVVKAALKSTKPTPKLAIKSKSTAGKPKPALKFKASAAAKAKAKAKPRIVPAKSKGRPASKAAKAKGKMAIRRKPPSKKIVKRSK